MIKRGKRRRGRPPVFVLDPNGRPIVGLAGYDKILCSKDLLTANLNVKRADNPLVDYLKENLKCTLEV